MKMTVLADEVLRLRNELAESQDTLRAIRCGEVDALIGDDSQRSQVFTLAGAGDAYRALIESMNEGALLLSTDKMILYANEHFAKMVQRPLEQVIGTSFKDFLGEQDRAPLRALFKGHGKDSPKVQLVLHTDAKTLLPVQVSARPLARNGAKNVTVGMVVTDMTTARLNEEMLRGFSQRLVQVQEAERERVALELHDHITQMLCAILVRSEVLTDKLSPHDKIGLREASKLRDMVGDAASAVERISRHLRPSMLGLLGLAAVVQTDSHEFATRTGLPLELQCDPLIDRLPAEGELALYRILQEALKNVEQHAQASRVTVHLVQQGACIELRIQDDGSGFDPAHPAQTAASRGYGLLSMSERAHAVGGTVSVTPAPGQGTTIRAQIPLATHPLSTR
jgi:two-component system NarL family sensor kinase